KGIVVAGVSSGVGKTTVSLGLMAALRKMGVRVQPFKCGPDFIDAGHHSRICGCPSRNLDGWMLSSETNRSIFNSCAQGADVCVVEGVMGLFDGASGKSQSGSTAEMAKLLGLPVVLVVDASAMAGSAAAIVHGFETFDPALHMAGVIFNRVGGPSHARLIREAMESNCRTPVLGFIERNESIQIPERYLGLFTEGEDLVTESKVSLLASIVEGSIDLKRFIEALPSVPVCDVPPTPALHRDLRIGVARDRAFCFYYEDNLDALRAAGLEIVEFSPLNDGHLPPSLDALYLGGGYPELYANQLSSNEPMLAAIRRFAAERRPIYAECGGLMVLAEEIVSVEGQAFPMASVLPLKVQMTSRVVKFGYAEVRLLRDRLWGAAGTTARGHSFHCSSITEAGNVDCVYHVRYGLAGKEEHEGFCIRNVLASYIHLHFLSNPEIPKFLARSIRCASKERRVKEPVEMERSC
ncbi:MAG TPA: cobyrinate a,c-diamide synthase, partial [Terriglobia bacterium]|nr:cobyrinate a,c-diamide synthase [Terriglobia bacterium]